MPGTSEIWETPGCSAGYLKGTSGHCSPAMTRLFRLAMSFAPGQKCYYIHPPEVGAMQAKAVGSRRWAQISELVCEDYDA